MPLPYVPAVTPLFASVVVSGILPVPSNTGGAVVSPPIVNVLPVANAVAVSALPVTLPVTLPIGLPYGVATLSALLSSEGHLH